MNTATKVVGGFLLGLAVVVIAGAAITAPGRDRRLLRAMERRANRNPMRGHMLVDLDTEQRSGVFVWRCRCNEQGRAADVDDALDAHRTHAEARTKGAER